MTTIYVVRHGQSVANARKEVAGSRESPLTLLGKKQALLAGQKAKALGVTRIICSPLERARQTAEIIARTTGISTSHIVVMPELIERSLGELEGQNYTHNQRLNGNYPETETVNNVEPLPHLHGRINYALRTILHDNKDQTVLIVCHMNPGRMLQAIVTGRPAIEMYDQPRLENGQIYQLITS
ncbi:MAG TPA: histidine phosphatase family protein [Candidatus Saccharimonadales bacterium]|nr:histidine phosphatase family protein [Candidatus Saccharimonadales bacterium]